MPGTETVQNTLYSFVQAVDQNRLQTCNLRLLTIANERLCLEKEVNNTVLLKQYQRMLYVDHLKTEKCKQMVLSVSTFDSPTREN